MNPDLPRLVPGISGIFFPLDDVVNVVETSDGQIGVTLTRGEWSESRTFPFPTYNKSLSILLQAWRAELITQEQP